MSKTNLIAASYSAVRRNPGCSSLASVTLLWHISSSPDVIIGKRGRYLVSVEISM